MRTPSLVTLLLFVCILPARLFAAGIGNDTIYSAQTICSGAVPAALTGTLPTGGTGVFTYKWQYSTTSATTGYTLISGATAQGYAPGALAATRWYRRIVLSGVYTDTSLPVQLTVTPILIHADNTIAAAQTICSATAPAAFTGSSPTGGDGINYNYVWQSSPNNSTWTAIGAATQCYAAGPLTATTYYRRIVSSGGCTDNSASIKITISPVIANNTIKSDQSLCTGQTPVPFTGTTPTGGNNTYTYLWLSSTTSSSAGFATAAGTVNGIGYSPASLTQTTWYRRVVTSGGCTDTSAAVAATVVNSPPGDPNQYGNNVWNVYAYTDVSFGTYAGFYTEPALSFATTSRYTNLQSPSYASGYQGCQVSPGTFSASMERTNFTAGYYKVDLTAVDDNMYMAVDGVLVYSKICCSAASNIWTGYLGPTDSVRINWTQASGTANLGLNFTAITPVAVNPGSISSSQQVCYGDVPNAFTSLAAATTSCTSKGYQWQSSIDSVTWTNIAGATALTYTVSTPMTQTTWYRRVFSDWCNFTVSTAPVKLTVNVIAPGDPSVFGDNVWNAYAYTYPAGNTSFSAATYKGFYVEPSLSFNSTSRWASGGAPSLASGYQGCYVPGTYNWMSYKRTNFTPAIYQIDIPSHDDWAYLFINGIQVFTHQGCCDAHTNVWTGPLGATDQIELRVLQGTGGSNGAITLTPVTPAPLQSGTVSPSQTICAGNIPPTPMAQTIAPTGGCTIAGYQWQSSTDNGGTWTDVSGATAGSYTVGNSVFIQTLYRRVVTDLCGNSAASTPDTVYMDNSAPGNPAVYGNNVWNVYCYQDVNRTIYAGYYTEPLLTFQTINRYSSSVTPSSAAGYQGCQIVNTYYSVSMKRTGFTTGIYQIDVTADDDYTTVLINGVVVSSLTYPAIQNNIWTGPLGPTDQIEVRWRNNAGPGQTGLRFTTVTPGTLTGGSVLAYNPNLCTGDIPVVNNVANASGACYVNYTWQSSVNSGGTWSTVAGATDSNFIATVSPAVPTQYRRIATDICGNTAYSNVVTFTPGAGAVGNPAVYGNGTWNAYAYTSNGSAFSSAIYMGYYTEPLLSFNSTNRWSSTGTPSSASGYQGCQVGVDYHWVSYKRTNFTTGTYQLDIPYHDDDVFLFINGVQVFTHVGCCDNHDNVWTGILGPADKVELRWHEYGGGSGGALTLTLVSPSTVITGNTIGASQTICSGTAPVAFTNTDSAHSSCYMNYQWQSQTNCTGGWTDIAGATGLIYAPAALTASTCFRRAAINSCGITSYSNTVTISIYSTALTPGTVSANQTICSGATAATLTGTAPTGGDGNYIYQWQSSPDGVGWSNIATATAATFAPGAITNTTWYRRNVTACAGGSSGTSAAVTITVNAAPAITVQPANAVSCTGGNTTIQVTATGTSLTYQWQVYNGTSWSNITNNATYSGATANTLNITGVTAGMSGYQYRVVVNGSCTPSVTSNTVTLTISTAPSISSQPASLTACAGSNTGFTVTASGSGLTYQWQQKIGAGAWTTLTNTGVYSGVTTASLVLTGITTGMNSYQYQCIINSSCGGSVTSAAAVLTVVAAINNTITADQSVCSGMTAANLSGTTSSPYAYIWQTSTVSNSSGFVNANGTNTNYYYTPGSPSQTTWYRRIVSNTGCSATSNVVSVTINPATITITANPASVAVCPGSTASFTASATGPGTLTWQWYEYNGSVWTAISNGGIYSGATTTTLTLTGVTLAMHNFRYLMKVYASGCTANNLNSNYAVLTTNNGPVSTYTNPDITTCTGNTVAINTTATGLGLTYQWQQNTGSGWNNLSNFGIYSNVTTNQLRMISLTTALDGSQYRCMIGGSCAPNKDSSGITTLHVNAAIGSNSVSSSQSMCAGTPAPFTASNPTGGDGSYTYQWINNTGSGWTNISGATGIGYTPGAVTQTTQYIRTVYSGNCTSNNSVAITVTIRPPTTITNDPLDSGVCAGTNAQFTVAATGTGPAYQWQVNPGTGVWTNLSNGTQYTGATAAILNVLTPSYSLNGYQYRCVVTGNCAPASVTSNYATLTVSPVAAITGQPANVSSCSGSTVIFSVTATGTALTYQWMEKIGSGAFTPITDGGVYSGATTAALTLTGITTSMNTNQYRCVITNGGCPVNSATAGLSVGQMPSLLITDPAGVCSPNTVNITAPAVTAGSSLYGGTLTWWKDAAATITQSSPTAINTSGTFYIRIATSTVCYDIKPVNVIINPIPTATITYSGTPYCATGVASPTQTGTSGGSYSSTTGLNINATTGAIDLDASTPGTYTITYAFTGTGGCTGSTTTSITVKALPAATITYAGSPYCATGAAAPTVTGTTGGTFTSSIAIDAATGAIDLSATPPGTYTVTYTFTGANGCSNTTTGNITIKPLPAATINYTGSPYCATGTAIPAITGTTGGAFTSSITIDAATGAIDLNATPPGTYTVTYSVTGANGCSNTTTAGITINPLPIASITYAGTPYCPTGTATPTITGTTGGTFTSTIAIDAATGAIDLSSTSSGTYTVTYTFTNAGGCSNTTTTNITVNPLPTASITYSGSPYCSAGTATPTLTGTTGGTFTSTITIDAATGAIDLNTTPPGTYTITYTFTGPNGCSNTTATSITINPLPTATISYAGSPYCPTGTATPAITGTTGGTFTSSITIDAATGAIDLTTTAPGTYTVTYTFTNASGCSNTTTSNITINPLPTASISYAGTPYCPTGTATPTITGTTGGTFTSTTTIDAATGAIDLGTTPPGTYTVTYTFTNAGGCSNTTTTNITINPLPTASIAYNGSPYCTVGTAMPTISGTTGGTFTSSIVLDAATGAIDLATTPPGTYTVTYTFMNANGCSNTATATIIIKPLTLVITDPAAVCAPNPVDLTKPSVTTGSETGMSYTYYNDATGTTTLSSPAAITAAGTYYIKGTNTSTGCYSDIQPVVVTINTPPTLTIGGNTDICKSSVDTLTANAPGSTIRWMDAAMVNDLGADASLIVAPAADTKYTAIATNAPGCHDTATISIQVRPFTLTLTASPLPALSGTTVTLTSSANFSYTTVAWLPLNEFSDQSALVQSVIVHDTTSAFYVIAQSAQGCQDTASVNVSVDVNMRDFFIPNAFTPNNDGRNDLFKVYGSSIKSVELRIFSQWGEMLFESHDQQKGWNGRNGSKDAPAGIYVYVVKAVFYNDKTITKKGTISLIR